MDTLNVFKILASGDGTLKEPNVSAFLKFLLDPKGLHGQGFATLKKFISIFDKRIGLEVDDTYSVNLFLEENLTKIYSKQEKTKKNIGDIYIEIMKENEPVCLIYIEVKIRNSLNLKHNQVQRQTIDILQFSQSIDVPKYYIFLTPDGAQYSKYFAIGQDKIQTNLMSIPISWKADIIPLLNFELFSDISLSFKDFIKSNFHSQHIEVKKGKNTVDFDLGYKTKDHISFFLGDRVDYILNKMRHLNYSNPDVTKRVVNKAKFTYRRKKGSDYEFRIDVNRNYIHCLLYVKPTQIADLNEKVRWSERLRNKKESKILYFKNITALTPMNEIELMMRDVETIISL